MVTGDDARYRALFGFMANAQPPQGAAPGATPSAPYRPGPAAYTNLAAGSANGLVGNTTTTAGHPTASYWAVPPASGGAPTLPTGSPPPSPAVTGGTPSPASPTAPTETAGFSLGRSLRNLFIRSGEADSSGDGAIPPVAHHVSNPAAGSPTSQGPDHATNREHGTDRPAATPQLPPQARAAGTQFSGWERLGDSVEGRPLEFARLGRGSEQVLVIGSLHGDQLAGIRLADRLAQHLARLPGRIDGLTLTIVRDANPDGRLAHRRENAHGVDLDRNFAAANWRKLPKGSWWLSGRMPQSEPETQAVVRLIDELRPTRVLYFVPSTHEYVAFSGPAQPLAAALATHINMPLEDSSLQSGSLASLTGEDRAIQTIVVALPADATDELLWQRFERGFLGAICGRVEPAGNVVPSSTDQVTTPPTMTAAGRAPNSPAATNDNVKSLATGPLRPLQRLPATGDLSQSGPQHDEEFVREGTPSPLTLESLHRGVPLVQLKPPRAATSFGADPSRSRLPSANDPPLEGSAPTEPSTSEPGRRGGPLLHRPLTGGSAANGPPRSGPAAIWRLPSNTPTGRSDGAAIEDGAVYDIERRLRLPQPPIPIAPPPGS